MIEEKTKAIKNLSGSYPLSFDLLYYSVALLFTIFITSNSLSASPTTNPHFQCDKGKCKSRNAPGVDSCGIHEDCKNYRCDDNHKCSPENNDDGVNGVVLGSCGGEGDDKKCGNACTSGGVQIAEPQSDLKCSVVCSDPDCQGKKFDEVVTTGQGANRKKFKCVRIGPCTTSNGSYKGNCGIECAAVSLQALTSQSRNTSPLNEDVPQANSETNSNNNTTDVSSPWKY